MDSPLTVVAGKSQGTIPHQEWEEKNPLLSHPGIFNQFEDVFSSKWLKFLTNVASDFIFLKKMFFQKNSIFSLVEISENYDLEK